MNNWPSVRLGEVVELLTGFPFKSDHYVDDETAPRLLRGDNIVQGTLRWDGVKRWPNNACSAVAGYWLQDGDVVLAMDRPWIERGLKYAAIRSSDLPALLVQRVACLRGTSRMDIRFLKYIIGSREFTDHVLAVHTGTTIPHISGGQIKSFEFRLPPISEQTSIAHILGTLDDKIELNRRQNETLEAMARALFKSWFVDFDPVRAKAEGRDTELPGHIAGLFPDAFDDSELGEIPKGWRAGRVADLCGAIFSGGTPSTQNASYWNGEIPWLSSGETREKFITGTEKHITQAGVSGSSTRQAPKFSTVIASAGQGNTRGQTSLLTFESYINQSVVALTSNPSVSSPSHLFFDLERRYEEFRRVSDAHSSRGSLTTKLLAGLGAVIPAHKVVLKFEEVAGPWVKQIVVNSQESKALADLRDALLPRLLSGNLRVPDQSRLEDGEV